jgi:hypothetical protein
MEAVNIRKKKSVRPKDEELRVEGGGIENDC